MLKDLVLKNRSYRRFAQEHVIGEGILRELVELARLTPSSANLQNLKYILSSDPERNGLIFPALAWAGYLKDWPGPEEGERPSGYIVILRDTDISSAESCDHGIAAQTILLGAAEIGLGGCIIGSIARKKLRRNFNIPDHLEILLVLALGKPIEAVKLETVGDDGSIEYWRDEKGVHHVPKRSLDDIIL
ncbi:MAG: nitroreductase family protein [bacterium]